MFIYISYAYVCVYARVCKYMCTFLCMHMEARAQHCRSSSITLYLILEVASQSLTGSRAHQFNYIGLAPELQTSSGL